jgi:hypothetical protein
VLRHRQPRTAGLPTSAANEAYAVPANAAGGIDIDWPCCVGIVVAPGAGGTLALSFT